MPPSNSNSSPYRVASPRPASSSLHMQYSPPPPSHTYTPGEMTAPSSSPGNSSQLRYALVPHATATPSSSATTPALFSRLIPIINTLQDLFTSVQNIDADEREGNEDNTMEIALPQIAVVGSQRYACFCVHRSFLSHIYIRSVHAFALTVCASLSLSLCLSVCRHEYDAIHNRLSSYVYRSTCSRDTR